MQQQQQQQQQRQRRIIIALDCDNFYVAVARTLDPRLSHLAIGITQKSLLATVSYEARALGLGKLQSIKDATQVVRALGGIVVRYDELKEEHLHYHDHNHNNHNNNDNDNNEDDDHHHNSTSTASPPNPSNPPNSSNPRPPPPLLVLVNGSDLTPFRRASHTVRWVVNSLLFVTTSTTTATTSNNSTTTNSTTTNSTIRTDSNANSNSSSNAAATATATAAARNRNRNSAANSRSGLNPLCSVSGTHATKILQNAANPVKMEQAEDQQEQESQESDTENVLPRTYVSVDHPSPSLSLFVLSEEDHTQHVHAQQVAHEAHEDSEKGASGKVRQWKWKAALKNADAQGAEVPVPSRTSNTNTMLRKRKRHDLTEHEHEHEHHRQKQSTSTNHGLTSLSSEAALAPAPNHRGTIAVPAGVAATTTTTSSDADDDTDIVSGPPQQQPYVQVQGGCEKLGLDEVFIDATALIDAHLASPVVTNERGETFFRLPSSAMNVLTLPSKASSGACNSDKSHLECGFWYPPSLTGHAIPHTATAAPPCRATIVASHLCAFLRRTIREKTGLTTSGGVAGSKMLAKLISSAHKPDGQTVWVGDDAQDSARTPVPTHHAVQEYLDPLLIRAIPGFGTHVISSLMTALPATASGDNATSREITVHQVRTSIPTSTFTRLFPGPLATTLYNLLRGIDPSPVRPTPEYPHQLSVEDSYAVNLTRPLHVILTQMLGLVKKLLERLEEELVGSSWERYSHGIVFSPPPATSAPRTWQRYPTQFRVTVRTFANTNSQSAAMPAFIFDTRVPAGDRAERVMRMVGKRLCCALLPGKIENEAQSFEVYVINVAATHLSTSAPPPSIGSLPTTRSRPEIDLSFIAGLPPEMREEIIRENRISRADVERIMAEHRKEVIEIDDDSDDETSIPTISAERIPRAESELIGKEDAAEGFDEEIVEDGRCHLCGAHVFDFAAPAHARWHAEQV